MTSQAKAPLVTARDYPTNAIFPNPPNFLSCHESYGTGINVADCIYAMDQLPSGNERVVYHLSDEGEFSVQDGNTMFALPQQRHHGTCTVTIRITPPTLPRTIRPIIPANIWGVAAGVVKRCVDDGFKGIGGFATWGLGTMFSFYKNPHISLGDPIPSYATFVTITITGPQGKTESPGDYDPMIPLKIYESQRDVQGGLLPSSSNPFSRAYLAMSLANGDNTTPWFNYVHDYFIESSSSPDEMIYQCDADLGAPTEIDCTYLEDSQFGTPSDTVNIDPSRPRTLSMKTCDLSISASTSIFLTWEQIGAALNALIGICITDSLGSVKGGRAFYGSEAFSSGGKIRKKRGRQMVSGLNALPPGVNLTLSQHGHGP